jgi:hypothetical protein
MVVLSRVSLRSDNDTSGLSEQTLTQALGLVRDQLSRSLLK